MWRKRRKKIEKFESDTADFSRLAEGGSKNCSKEGSHPANEYS